MKQLILALLLAAAVHAQMSGPFFGPVVAQATAPGTVATPSFSPAGGTYSSTQTVTISTTTPLAVLCYTTDGSTPTEVSYLCSGGTTSTYSTPITVSTTQTVKAIGTLATYTDSAVASATYTISASNTWTLVRHTLVLLPCNNSTSCSISVSAIGSGNVLVLVESGAESGSAHISNSFGATGGTWVHPGGSSAGACSTNNSAVATDCAYVLHTTSCPSSCSITYTTSGNFSFDSADVFEYTPSTGSAAYDAANTGSGSFSTAPPVVGLTISGTSDLVVQSVTGQDNYCTAIGSPYTSATDFTVNPNSSIAGYAAAINLSSVSSSPTWTCGNTRYVTVGVAFK